MRNAAKRQHQREKARDFRRRPPSEQLETAIDGGLLMRPFPWKLGHGVEYLCVAYIGDGPGPLAELTEAYPEQCAVVERPATVAIFRVGSEAGALFAEGIGAGGPLHGY